MRRIGHRGAKAHAPENTIAAFQKALDLGCDEVETDVWLMDTGALVISHDRPASAAGLLTLDDVLDFCRGRMAVNVELKCGLSDAQAALTGERVARHLRQRADPDVYVSSFWYPALSAARAAAPAVRRAFVFGAAPDMAALLSQARALELWALHPEHWYVTAERVAASHGAGLAVNTWTVNDPSEIALLAGWGVDGIMSDHPERVPKG